MGRFRSTMRQSPAIIISLIALTFSLGGGIGYAASVTTAKTPATKITWHRLGLINKWHEVFVTNGAPSYAISNGIVYLYGAMQGGTTNEFAVLPKAARPKNTLYIAVYNDDNSGGSAWLDVTPRGQMFINGPDDTILSSIAGVSFPAGA
jgi:hypothetical protein